MAKKTSVVSVCTLIATTFFTGFAAQELESDPVSFVQLLANPKDFHGRVVTVAGYCYLEFEGNALYLHKEDFDRTIMKNAVWLDVGWPVLPQWESAGDEYVEIEATFDAERLGHSRLFSGTLKDIRRIDRIPPRTEIDRTLRLRAPRSQMPDRRKE